MLRPTRATRQAHSRRSSGRESWDGTVQVLIRCPCFRRTRAVFSPCESESSLSIEEVGHVEAKYLWSMNDLPSARSSPRCLISRGTTSLAAGRWLCARRAAQKKLPRRNRLPTWRCRVCRVWSYLAGAAGHFPQILTLAMSGAVSG